MSGRAGRRGLDEKGTVMIYIRDLYEMPDSLLMKEIVDHKGEELQSKFRLTYGIIFNLLLSKEINVVDVMRKSFNEANRVAAAPEQQIKAKARKNELALLKKNFSCTKTPFAEAWPIEEYYNNVQILKENLETLWTLDNVIENLSFPKFATIIGKNAETDTAIIISKQKNGNEWRFTAFMTDNINSQKKIEISYEEEYKSSKSGFSGIISDTSYKCMDLFASQILEIYEEKIKVDKIDKQPDRRQQNDLVEAIKEFKKKNSGKIQDKMLTSYQIASRSKNDLIQNLNQQIKQLKTVIFGHACHQCELKYNHLGVFERKLAIKQEIKEIEEELAQENIGKMGEFENRIKILQKLNYLDENQIPLIKARVGRELGSTDIFLCEVLMENILEDLSPEELAALLSAFVCQVKKTEVDNNDLLPDTLLDAMDAVEDMCKSIIDLEVEHMIIIEDEKKYLDEKVNFALCKVVYEWACQKDFVEVCKLTDAQEGSIVRTILRLDILLRDLKSACKVMGNMKLHRVVDEASHLIKRDIVFAESLYLAE